MPFNLIYSRKAQKQHRKLSLIFQTQYNKAFILLATHGPHYQSLRTHRYHIGKQKLWGSSASMFLRFYWRYQDKLTILVILLDSH